MYLLRCFFKFSLQICVVNVCDKKIKLKLPLSYLIDSNSYNFVVAIREKFQEQLAKVTPNISDWAIFEML